MSFHKKEDYAILVFFFKNKIIFFKISMNFQNKSIAKYCWDSFIRRNDFKTLAMLNCSMYDLPEDTCRYFRQRKKSPISRRLRTSDCVEKGDIFVP